MALWVSVLITGLSDEATKRQFTIQRLLFVVYGLLFIVKSNVVIPPNSTPMPRSIGRAKSAFLKTSVPNSVQLCG